MSHCGHFSWRSATELSEPICYSPSPEMGAKVKNEDTGPVGLITIMYDTGRIPWVVDAQNS